MWSWKDKPKSNLQSLLNDREALLLEQMEIKHQLNLVDEKIEYFNSQSKSESSTTNGNTTVTSSTDRLETAR